MKLITKLALPAFALFAGAAPAAAADLAPGFTINGGATVVSDYRFRGISQTNKRFALQGTFTIGHSSGAYASVWGSSIDDYVAGFSDQEIDLIAGYKKTFGSTTFDVGATYYYYPGAEEVFPGYDSDFIEPYVKVTQAFGPVSATGTVAYAPKQNALSIGNGKEDNLYLAGDLGYALPKTPFGLSAHFGHSFGPSYLTLGKEYSDWSLGATFTKGPLVAGVQYVDTNKSFRPIDRNVSGSGIVGSLGVAF